MTSNCPDRYTDIDWILFKKFNIFKHMWILLKTFTTYKQMLSLFKQTHMHSTQCHIEYCSTSSTCSSIFEYSNMCIIRRCLIFFQTNQTSSKVCDIQTITNIQSCLNTPISIPSLYRPDIAVVHMLKNVWTYSKFE